MILQEAERLLPGWEFQTIERNGVHAGWVCIKGAEIHCARDESFKGRWLTRQTIEKMMLPILKKHGYVLTKVRTSNALGHEFVTRLGFKKVGTDGTNTLYRAERLNHARL